MSRITSDAELRELIESARTIAVVGLSPKEYRDSHRVARYLQRQGYRVIPVNPNASEILGERCYERLTQIDEPVDIVDVFRRPEFVPDVARDAVEIGAGTLWMQVEIVNDTAADIAEAGGVSVVMDRCLMVDHNRLVRLGDSGED